ncbi:MAG: hypothetical protein H6595_11830 [Flavobacteriales bacterium]|nr:hypothetical protein [Flavobacteriales bacterium]MCB9168150.1 hypothetical protein [Flavobacteriales bacterium]MCB9194285.1 hypothetical protein [Flavobacteriales bacterium]
MLDQIINSLKEQVGGDLMQKVGLDQQQTNGAIETAGDSVKDVIGGGGGLDLGTVLNLFSKEQNSSAANDLLGKLSSDYLGKLTGKLGLDAGKAASVKDLVIPALMSLLGNKVGGNKDMLGSLLGDAGKGLLGGLGDKLGGLGKLFG